MLNRSPRALLVCVGAMIIALLAWACDLNPHPLPPGDNASDAARTPGPNGETGGDHAADSGSNNGFGNSDAADVPTRDGGSDVTPPSGDSGPEAESDATSDGPLDGESDADHGDW